MQSDVIEEMKCNVEASNQNKAATRLIADYAVAETLGSGAFGTVYKVRKQSGQSFLAMKEASYISNRYVYDHFKNRSRFSKCSKARSHAFNAADCASLHRSVVCQSVSMSCNTFVARGSRQIIGPADWIFVTLGPLRL